MEHRSTGGQSFDGLEFSAVDLYREQKTRTHGFIIQKNRARAANPVFATDVCSRKTEIIADKVGQELARLHNTPIKTPIDCHFDFLLAHLLLVSLPYS
jgi:hypothetical protein